MQIGEKYNHWTIIDEAPSKNKKKYWLCQCDCGTIRAVLGSDLKNNKSKSCGCIRQPRFTDEIGHVYGRLTVIKQMDNTSEGKAQWLCQCKCGNQVVVQGVLLRNGTTQSCGCYQKEQTSKAVTKDLIGQTIGNFTILESITGTKYGQKHSWRCRCNLCGSEDNIISTSNLYRQYSCGCSVSSKGQRKIKEILTNNNIKFIEEKRFSNCNFDTNGNGHTQARFDFFLPDYNCIIEYDGVQHFVQRQGLFDNPEKFQITQQRDQIKNKWCKENNIHLIRIPYTHYDKLVLADLLPATSKFLL